MKTPLLYILSLVKPHAAALEEALPHRGSLGVKDVPPAFSQVAETPVLDWECVEVHSYSRHVASGYHPELLSCGSKDHVC